MRKFYKTLLFLSSTVLLSCGFQIVDQSNVGNFNIMEITSSGNKSINHKLKNKLTISSKNNNKRPIIIDLNTTKTKKIKEKNIKNEITKYEVSISTTVKAANINNHLDSFYPLYEVMAGSVVIVNYYPFVYILFSSGLNIHRVYTSSSRYSFSRFLMNPGDLR